MWRDLNPWVMGPYSAIHNTSIHCPCVYHVSTLLPLQFLRKVGQKFFINGKLYNLSRDVALRVIGPWPWFWKMIQQPTVHVCAKFQLWSYMYNSSREICNENFSFMANCKFIMGFNSKSYGPLALILVYKIHQPTVHVCNLASIYFELMLNR